MSCVSIYMTYRIVLEMIIHDKGIILIDIGNHMIRCIGLNKQHLN